MARIARVHGSGLSNLKLDQLVLPDPKNNDVKLKVLSTTITGDQLNFINGRRLPGEANHHDVYPLGYEATGIVTEIGPDVDPKWLNQAVTPIGPYDFNCYPSLGDEIIVPADRLVLTPSNLSPEQATILWVPYLTAYALKYLGHISATDRVLIVAGTSSVGLAAIQIAQATGAQVFATTRSREKAQQLKDITGLPEEHIIISSEVNLLDQINSLTAGQGVSLIFDPIGGDTITDLAEVAAPQAMIIEYGVINGLEAPLPVSQLIGKGLTIRGWAVSEVVENPPARKQAVDYILQNVEDGHFSPHVAKTYPLSEVVTAYQDLQINRQVGRIVLKP